MTSLIANTDASGEVGRRVAERLAERGIRQRLIVTEGADAPELPNAEVVTITGYGDLESVRAAAAGVETLFLIPLREHPERVQQHRAAVDAAVAAGVERIVYSSFLGAAPDATFVLARDHYATEEHIKSTGVAYTFLRGSAYLEVLRWIIGSDGVIRGRPVRVVSRRSPGTTWPTSLPPSWPRTGRTTASPTTSPAPVPSPCMTWLRSLPW